MVAPKTILQKHLKPRIVVICGATATGKTVVAIALAGKLKGEIIGADSMQIYRHMDIGTAKPTPAERAAARHHLVDVIDPDQPYDAARFARDARRLISDLVKRRVLPLVVGGTGLYIKALLHGLFDQRPHDPQLRQRLKAEALSFGGDFLHRRLQVQDPEGAAKIHPHDTYRIIRALEVYALTQASITDHHQQHGFAEQPYRSLKIGLFMDRELLYQRINARVEAMLEAGLLGEVKQLLAAGYGPQLKAMQSIGYRHMAAYLKGETDWDEAVRTMKRDTRRYAKRQMTWFKADEEIVWKEPHQMDEIEALVTDFLT